MEQNKLARKPVSMRQFVLHDDNGDTRLAKVGETIRLEDSEPVVIVRAELLARLLVYLTKFKEKIQSTNVNGLSRFMPAEDFEMLVRLQGFTPEDFNALMSLTTSITDGMEFLKEVTTPQMTRPPKDREQLRLTGGPVLSLEDIAAQNKIASLPRERDIFVQELQSREFAEGKGEDDGR